jgi:hypothetical protein
MTRTVIVNVAAPEVQMPVGPAPQSIVITLVNVDTTQPAIPPQTVPVGVTVSATFDAVPAGTYTATAQTIDVNGGHLGAAATSAQYVVADLTMAVNVPVSITIAAQ